MVAYVWAMGVFNQQRKSISQKSVTPYFLVGKFPKCGEANFAAKNVKEDDLPPNTIFVQERKLIELIFYVLESSKIYTSQTDRP